MFRDSLRTHGPKQFEVKQKIPFPKEANKVKYSVDTYFYVPSALQVNSTTLDKTEFLKSLKCYVRTRGPHPSLKKLLIHVEDLVKAVDKALEEGEETDKDALENQLKWFSLAYKRAINKAAKNLTNQEDLSEEEIAEFLRQVKSILWSFRAAKKRFESCEVAKIFKEANSVGLFDCFDEYLSVITSSCLQNLLLALPENKNREVRTFATEETAYRKANYPFEVPEGESVGTAFLLRWSVIKKYVSSYLFLDIRYKAGAPLLVHSIYGVAAALSMLFATCVAFIWQGKYGSLSINLFIALIIAYIFKDRFKEICRDWLSKVIFKRWIPDRRMLIFKEPNIEVGSVKESFDYPKSKDIPDFIKAEMKAAHWIPILPERSRSSVFRYRKVVTIRNEAKAFPDGCNCFVDIVRFNIGYFLTNIGPKFTDLPIYDSEEIPVGEKLYHIYMLRVLNFENTTDTEIIRLVVNADGIKRIVLVKPYRDSATNIEEEDEISFPKNLPPS